MPTEPFLGEISIVSFNFAARGWADCNGQLLPININQALFSLLGTTYGGDGRTTFALPDLRGRVPLHAGAGYILGQRAGEERHTLVSSEMPTHNHLPAASNTASQDEPTGGVWGTSVLGDNNYAPTANATMRANIVNNTGGSQPHENRMPSLALKYVIALQGIFPSPNEPGE